MLGIIVGIALAALFGAVVIWLVARLGLGIEVAGFGSAFASALAIAILGGLATALLSALGITVDTGLVGAIVHFVIAAIVLLIASRILPGLTVKGFGGALIGSVAIAGVAWLLTWVLRALLHL